MPRTLCLRGCQHHIISTEFTLLTMVYWAVRIMPLSVFSSIKLLLLPWACWLCASSHSAVVSWALFSALWVLSPLHYNLQCISMQEGGKIYSTASIYVSRQTTSQIKLVKFLSTCISTGVSLKKKNERMNMLNHSARERGTLHHIKVN